MPGRLGVDDPATGLHDAERDLPGGPEDRRPVRDGYLEGSADGGGGGWLGVVGPQIAGAPRGDLVQHAGRGISHLGAQRVGRIAGEQVSDRLAELAVGWAVHAQQVPGRVIARNFGAGQRGFAPVGHPPRRGAFYAQQILIPVDHVHGLAASRGRDIGVVFAEHRREPAAGLGSEGEGGCGGPAGRGAGCGHGGTPSAPRSSSLPELRHRRTAPAPDGAPRVLGQGARHPIPGGPYCGYLDVQLASQVTGPFRRARASGLQALGGRAAYRWRATPSWQLRTRP